MVDARAAVQGRLVAGTRGAVAAARRARHRPRPVQTVTFNAMSVHAGRARAERVFRQVLATKPAMAGGTECFDFDAAAVAGPGWDVVQFGYGDGDGGHRGASRRELAGCVLAVRDDVAQVVEGSESLRLGSAATREGWWKTGAGIGARYILVARVRFHTGRRFERTRRVAVGHPPPGRAPYARAAFMARLVRVRAAVTMGDLNLRRGEVLGWLARAGRSGFRVFSVGVLHVITAPWQPASGGEAMQVGSDHMAVRVTLWPRKGGRGKGGKR